MNSALESFPTVLSMHSIYGDALELFRTISSIHSIHGDALELFRTISSIHSIHGDKLMKAVDQQYDVIFTTDIATIGLQFAGSKLTKIDYLNRKKDKAATAKLAESVKSQIEKYLNPKSKLKNINISLQLNVTSFQQSVLKQLQQIPYGETRSYGEIAKILNTSPRAVGNACRNNPVPIIIPCHRVIAANGIGGYDGAKSGSRLNIKRRLLENEGIVL